MTTCNLPYFGEIEPAAIDKYHLVDTEFEGHPLRITMSVDTKPIEEVKLEAARYILDNIAALHAQNMLLLKKDHEAQGVTVDYLLWFVDNYKEEDLATLIDITNEDHSWDVLLFPKLQLRRVSILPEMKKYFALFDYVIIVNGDYHDHSLAVKVHEKGDLYKIEWDM